MAEEYDSDPIEKEIPVFLSQRAAEDVRLLQYPIRTAHRSLEKDEHDLGQVRDVYYDAENDKLSLKYYLNTDSERYMNVNEDKEMMHIQFSSSLVSQASNYCVGIMRNDELFISPIQSIYQMRPDFNRNNPNIADNKNDDDTNKSHNEYMINCQIDHNKDNDDLFYNQQRGQLQTRQFIENKQEFLSKCFNQNNNVYNNYNNNYNKAPQQKQYNDINEIPPGITQNESLKLPLNQSICHYLRECIVLKPSQIFDQLHCDNYDKQINAMRELSNFGYLVDGRFIVKHQYLRDSSLKCYKNEWNLLIQLFYKHKCMIFRYQFIEIIGENNMEYHVVDKMLNLLANKQKNIKQFKNKNKRFVWCLKHNAFDVKMIKSQFVDLYSRSQEVIKRLIDKNEKNYQQQIDIDHDDDDDDEMDIDDDDNHNKNEYEYEEKENDDPRQSMKYVSCKKFVLQKLEKSKVLTWNSIKKLLVKYGKQYDVLSEIPDDILQMVCNDNCWLIHDEKYCLKQIEGLKDMKQYNQHRKIIIDWFNKNKKEEIKKSMIMKQWKGLTQPKKDIFKLIMTSICDRNNDKNIWCLKTGLHKKKR